MNGLLTAMSKPDIPSASSIRECLRFPVEGGSLSDFKTDAGEWLSRDTAKDMIASNAEAIAPLAHRLYAEADRKLLVVLQGMDTSGKDSTVEAVFARTPPLNVRVESFKAPSRRELAHDYLWRVHARVPAAGRITVFNRSHYEDVLV